MFLFYANFCDDFFIFFLVVADFRDVRKGGFVGKREFYGDIKRSFSGSCGRRLLSGVFASVQLLAEDNFAVFRDGPEVVDQGEPFVGVF